MPALASLGTTEVGNAPSPRPYALHQRFIQCARWNVPGEPVNPQDVKEYNMGITAHSRSQHC
eukprot:10863255-Karenia_brevis.AAC.1